MSLSRAMPHRPAAVRRLAVPCPRCEAERYERCRRWVAEGHWEYLKTLHPERKAA
jgi:hypothetical protein